jgi:hypothetical protein
MSQKTFGEWNIFQTCPKEAWSQHDIEEVTENVVKGSSIDSYTLKFHGIPYRYTTAIVKCKKCGQIFGRMTDGTYYRIYRNS